MVFPILHCL